MLHYNYMVVARHDGMCAQHIARETNCLCVLLGTPQASISMSKLILHFLTTGGLYHFPPIFALFFCTCHNFFPLSSVQIIIIPACCLLCVF